MRPDYYSILNLLPADDAELAEHILGRLAESPDPQVRWLIGKLNRFVSQWTIERTAAKAFFSPAYEEAVEATSEAVESLLGNRPAYEPPPASPPESAEPPKPPSQVAGKEQPKRKMSDAQEEQVERAIRTMRNKPKLRYHDVMRIARCNSQSYSEAKRRLAAEAGVSTKTVEPSTETVENRTEAPESCAEISTEPTRVLEAPPEPECVKLPFVVGDEAAGETGSVPFKQKAPEISSEAEPDVPFVAPPGFCQPKGTNTAPRPEERPEERKARPLDELPPQTRVLALREMRASGNAIEAARVSGLWPGECRAVLEAYGQQLEGYFLAENPELKPAMRVELALQRLLVEWQKVFHVPDEARPKARRSA